MKVYHLSEERTIVVKKKHGELTVYIKQKDTEKSVSFTPARYLVISYAV